ncbi:MAG: sterol desaturase family protein [Ekhidna sp.]|uniref:sterol desaturase family protein n=1 Tax=Ekhidna sp. TaxID=2608089 RepID=UPI0032EE6324
MELEKLTDLFPKVYFNIGIRYLLAAGLAFLVFYVLFRSRFLTRRIQQAFPRTADYRRDLLYSLLTVFFFTIIALLTFFVLRPYTLLYVSLSDKTVWYWLLTVIPMFFIHDFYFYWAHRLMHHPKLFKAVHKIHHLSTNPSPWTAYAFHPLEAFIEAAIILILAFTVPTHAFVIMLFMIFQIIYNVYGHLGYELFPAGFHKTWIGKYINTSVAHNQHHARFHGNYGLYTLIWDRLFGTVREDYDASFEQATGKQ